MPRATRNVQFLQDGKTRQSSEFRGIDETGHEIDAGHLEVLIGQVSNVPDWRARAVDVDGSADPQDPFGYRAIGREGRHGQTLKYARKNEAGRMANLPD